MSEDLRMPKSRAWAEGDDNLLADATEEFYVEVERILEEYWRYKTEVILNDLLPPPETPEYAWDLVGVVLAGTRIDRRSWGAKTFHVTEAWPGCGCWADSDVPRPDLP